MSETKTTTQNAETAAKKQPTTMQTRANNAVSAVFGSVISQLENQNIKLTDYQRTCGINAVTAIDTMLAQKNISWGDASLDASNYQAIIRNVALLELNAAASNREIYFQMRSVNYKGRKDSADNWKQIVEVGIEGDGNEAILRKFGVNVADVLPVWLVRENDTFVYPKHKGIITTDPEWEETGEGKVVRVVYPIILNGGKIEYRISERADVAKNLCAHINNNMMNETFGLCVDRYKATADQKAKIAEKKSEIMAKIKNLTLDEILSCPDVQDFISDAWKSPQSSEAMIIRKMKNNAIKKFPKNFGSAYAADSYNELSDESVRDTVTEIKTAANTGEVIDVEPTPVAEAKAEQENKTPDVDTNAGY
jgi:hypothetical protein